MISARARKTASMFKFMKIVTFLKILMIILEKYKFDPKKEIDKIVSNVPKDPTRSRDPRTRPLRSIYLSFWISI